MLKRSLKVTSIVVLAMLMVVTASQFVFADAPTNYFPVLNINAGYEYVRAFQLDYAEINEDCSGTTGNINNTITVVPETERRSKGIVTAPHAVAHWRITKGVGAKKIADRNTGAIARALSQVAFGKRPFAITNCYYNNPDYRVDPNNDFYKDANGNVICNFTDEIVNLVNNSKLKDGTVLANAEIKYLVDIHGATNDHGFIVAVGTGDKAADTVCGKLEDIKTAIRASYAKYINVDIDNKLVFNVDKFSAIGEGTIAQKVHKETGIPCIQIEISAAYRNMDDQEKFIQTLNFLADVLHSLEDIL